MADPQDPILHALVEAFVDAWNRHDAHALAATFSPDAELVNFRGRRFSGAGAIERFFTAAFTANFAGSKLTPTEVRIRHASGSVASVDVVWTMSGVKGGEGNVRPDHPGLLDLVVVRTSSGGVRVFGAHLRDLPPDAPAAKRAGGPSGPG